jgi:hypothetical protein
MAIQKKITELPIIASASTTSVIPIVVNGVTSQINKNNFLNNISNFTGNTDSFDAFTQRTIFSRINTITYTEAASDVNFLSGTSANSVGSVTFPTSFFQNSSNYRSKILHFRVVGKTSSGSNSETINVSMKIGNQILTGSSIGNQTVDFFQNKPFEIAGEIIFNNSQVSVCYSLGYCDQTGDFKKIPLSDPTTQQTISGFTGGDLQLIIGTATTINMSSYFGYVQMWT